MWHSHVEFKECISHSWNIHVHGSTMFHISRKFERICKEVRGWNEASFSNIFKEKKKTKKKLKSLQASLASGISSLDHQNEEKECWTKWKVLLEWEEIFWKQLSMVKWMEEGNTNTTFFHRLKPKRKKRNTMNLLVEYNGYEVLEEDEIENWASNYYQEIYNPLPSQISIKTQVDILRIMHLVVDDKMNNNLIAKFM